MTAFPWFSPVKVLCALLLVSGLGGSLLISSCWGSRLSEQERRGRELYLKTASPSGNPIRAYIGRESVEAPGAAVACVHCHGHDGKGRDEAGVAATDITWEELTKAYGVKRVKGRMHPPYDEDAVVRAIREGVDSGGTRLDPVMPRYVMAEQDYQDLLAYLRIIGTVLDPGLTWSKITLGSILPLQGRLQPMGLAMEAVLRAYFSEINRAGGLFNREIQLQVGEMGDTPQTILDVAGKMIGDEGVFAFVSPIISGVDKEFADLAEREEIPLLGPLTFFPEDIAVLNRFTFYLFSGLREQARAMIIYAAGELFQEGTKGVVLYPSDDIPQDIVRALEEQVERSTRAAFRWRPFVVKDFDGTKEALDILERAESMVFFLGDWKHFSSLVQATGIRDGSQVFFVPGYAVTEEVFELPDSLHGRIHLSYPTLPMDQTQEGLRDYAELAERHSLPAHSFAAQISALCSAKIFVEGVKRAGRNLSRERLVSELERLFQFNTGLTPAITYDPNRRVGASGAYVVKVDLKGRSFVPVSQWIPVD